MDMRTGLLKLTLLAVLCGLAAPCKAQDAPQGEEKVVIAYVFTKNAPLPDPSYLTHINYAFAHVSDSYDGVRIDMPRRLRQIVKLKKQAPGLKVLLSIGGWGSGRFSEMAADSLNRTSFARACKKIVRRYRLDGIDIDWEYPTTSVAKISSSPEDTENYTKLMRDLRAALGDGKLLSHAVVSSARFMDYVAVDQYVDFTNVMTYDMGWPPYHNSPLYRSPRTDPTSGSVSESILHFIELGLSPEKIVLGLSFGGHGVKGFRRPKDVTMIKDTDEYYLHWDDEAQVPYLTDSKTGEYVYGFENTESLRLKCEFAKELGLKGCMYWQYYGDNAAGDLRRTVYQTLNSELL